MSKLEDNIGVFLAIIFINEQTINKIVRSKGTGQGQNATISSNDITESTASVYAG